MTKQACSFIIKKCLIIRIVYKGGETIVNQAVKEIVKTKDINKEFLFRKPTKDDGAAVWELIEHTGVLDLNSSYSYLLWCEVFSETSIVAENNGEIVGFISAFIHPEKPNTLFVWQVAVHESARGNGLATRMLSQLLERNFSESKMYVEATVSPSNKPSQNLFKGFAKKSDTNCTISDYFMAADFPREGHEDELLFKIGPIVKN